MSGSSPQPFVAGTTLTAGSLNTAFNSVLPLAGGTLVGDLTIGGNLTTHGETSTVRTVSANYTVATIDRTLMCTQTAAITVTLPTTGTAVGRRLTIKDQLGTASTHPITLAGPVELGTNFVLSNNLESVDIMWNGSAWSIT